MASKLYATISSARGLFAWESGDDKKKNAQHYSSDPPLSVFCPPMMQLEVRKGHMDIFRESSSYLIPNMADKCQ